MFKKFKSDKHYVLIAFKKFNLILFFDKHRNPKNYLKNGKDYRIKTLSKTIMPKKSNSWHDFVFKFLIGKIGAELDNDANTQEEI